jgi:hypothetical protein
MLILLQAVPSGFDVVPFFFVKSYKLATTVVCTARKQRNECSPDVHTGVYDVYGAHSTVGASHRLPNKFREIGEDGIRWRTRGYKP